METQTIVISLIVVIIFFIGAFKYKEKLINNNKFTYDQLQSKIQKLNMAVKAEIN